VLHVNAHVDHIDEHVDLHGALPSHAGGDIDHGQDVSPVGSPGTASSTSRPGPPSPAPDASAAPSPRPGVTT
jgi:hypothetical protein